MTYRRFVVSVLVMSALAIAAGAFGQETVKLEMKFTPGELLRYKMVMDGNLNLSGTAPDMPQMPNMRMRLVAVIRERVKRVLPTGDAEVNALVESMKFTMADKTMQFPTDKMKPVTMIMGTNGQVKSIQGDQAMMSAYPGAQFISPGSLGQFGALPSGDLIVGESWSQSIPFPMGGGNVLLVGRLLTANERLGANRVAVIRQDVSGDLDIKPQAMSYAGQQAQMPPISAKGKFRGYGQTFFAPEKGRVVRTEGAMEALMNMSGASCGGASGSASMTLQLNFEMFLLPS